MKRCSGVLMSVPSLAGEYGAGTLNDACIFLEMLKEAGQSVWQMLPEVTVGESFSPYRPFSAFAGNPLFISPDYLYERGLITRQEMIDARLPLSDRIDYKSVVPVRTALLKMAFERNKTMHKTEYPLNKRVEDYCVFSALRNYFKKPLVNWDEDIRKRHPRAILKYSGILKEDIAFREFMQMCFFDEWQGLKSCAKSFGITVMGDLPVYVSDDSSDVWTCPQDFLVDDDFSPKVTAGVPPDCFSPNGQNWENPVYDYSNMQKDGFKWWKERIEHAFSLYGAVRIDHFRSFDEYYVIPKGESTQKGSWQKGPGRPLIDAILCSSKGLVIAEDLGGETEGVKKLLEYSGFPGMRVAQFGFGSDENNKNLPHMYPENCVAYTGTHDNDTVKGWFEKTGEGERGFLRTYLNISEEDCPVKALISSVMHSRAALAVIPVQDWQELDTHARLNIPGTAEGNWLWRMTSPLPLKYMQILTEMSGRS